MGFHIFSFIFIHSYEYIYFCVFTFKVLARIPPGIGIVFVENRLPEARQKFPPRSQNGARMHPQSAKVCSIQPELVQIPIGINQNVRLGRFGCRAQVVVVHQCRFSDPKDCPESAFLEILQVENGIKTEQWGPDRYRDSLKTIPRCGLTKKHETQ